MDRLNDFNFQRVFVNAVYLKLIVQMGAGRQACHSNIADYLALLYPAAQSGRGVEPGKVGVQSAVFVVVLDDNHVSVAALSPPK